MSANERQVDGNHYLKLAAEGKGEQHWDMMWRLYGEPWFVGNITKYVLRYKHKNGLGDLEKARHYLEKLIELETAAAVEEKLGPPAEGYERTVSMTWPGPQGKADSPFEMVCSVDKKTQETQAKTSDPPRCEKWVNGSVRCSLPAGHKGRHVNIPPGEKKS